MSLKEKFLYKFFKIFIILSVAFIITALTTVKIFEKQGSKNIAINICKRIVAEGGNFIARYIPIEEEANKLSFGLREKQLVNSEEDIIRYLKRAFATGVIEVRDVKNFDVSESSRDFQYENFANPKLQLLRKKYWLDELGSSASSELEKIIILRDWVRKIIPKGTPKNVDYNFNALDILSRAEKREEFFCSEYSTVFVQCALSLGFIGRYIGLLKGHVVAEIWSNEYAKWIVMDVQNNLHYEKYGVPLGALELHNLWENKALSNINVLEGVEKRSFLENTIEDLLSYYHEFYVRMRNDWFSNRYPHWHPKGNSIMNSLEWQDAYTSNNILVAKETYDKDALNFSLNTVSIMVDKASSLDEQLCLILNTFTPNFSHFLITVDERSPERQDKPDFIWKLHKGINKIQVRSVNSLGVEGPASKVEFILS